MLSAILITSAACGRERASAVHGGTLVVSAPADADNLFPPLTATIQGRQVVDQIFDYLADIGPALNTVGDAGFTPRLAERWEWSPDSLSITFHLNPRARWHDGVPVTARDVQFTVRLIMDSTLASPVASVMPDIDSVSVRDSLTAVVWYKRRTPEQFFELVYNVAVLPQHLLQGQNPKALASSPFARRPVGSGRFRFAQWDAEARMVVVSDTNNYRGRAKLDRVVWLVAPDMQVATTRLLAGAADVLDVIRGPTVAQVQASPTLRVVTWPSLDYGYLGFNLKRPMFSNLEVRRALSMAIDRTALVRNVFDTLASVGLGPVTLAQPTADPTATGLLYDTATARKILAAHGPLAFHILVPTSSAVRMRYATLLQEQYRKVGVTVTIDALELNAFAQRLQARDFDAVLNAWHTDPSPSAVRQAWGSAAVHDGPNFTSYASPMFDALVDSAATARDPAHARALYQRAYAVIVHDAPAVWLYESRTVAGAKRRVQMVGARPDAWWADLADWTLSQ